MAGEKTEHPTPKRLRKAREDGMTAISADLISAIIFLVILIMLVNLRWNDFFLYMEKLFLLRQSVFSALRETHYFLLKIIIICVLPVFVAGVLAGFIQTGGLITFKPPWPKMERLNPVKKLKQIFSKKNFFEFVKIVFKSGSIISLFLISFMSVIKILTSLNFVSPRLIPGILRNSALEFLKPLLVFMCLLGILDFIYQRKSLIKELMMTKEEVKEEFKEDEGNPEIKGRRRQLHQEISMHSLRESVKGASFVVVNPQHIAVALRYKEDEENAPRVVAKGQDAIAREIIKIAGENSVPVFRNVPLAHALFRIEEGEEIPEELYTAVAEILIQIEENEHMEQ